MVADRRAAERVAIELVRNALIARPHTAVLAAGIDSWPVLGAFLDAEASKYQASSDDTVGRRGVCVVGEGPATEQPDPAGTTIAMPGAPSGSASAKRTELALGAPTGDIVVVPGTARLENGVHTLTAETYGRLRRAEQIARRRPVRAVILSGWNGPNDLGLSEAAQMRDAWRGPAVPIILDEAARTTAENALWSASLAGALGDVHKLCMVTSWVSSVRLGLATMAALRDAGVRLRLSVVWGHDQAASWRPAIGGLVHLRRHLRIGRTLIAEGPGSPGAQL